jgi:hypothetical protein
MKEKFPKKNRDSRKFEPKFKTDNRKFESKFEPKFDPKFKAGESKFKTREAEIKPAPAGSPLGYRLLTGIDDRQFCEKVSEALASGYQLYGSPAITFNGKNCIVAQAVTRSPISRPRFNSSSDAKPFRTQSKKHF